MICTENSHLSYFLVRPKQEQSFFGVIIIFPCRFARDVTGAEDGRQELGSWRCGCLEIHHLVSLAAEHGLVFQWATLTCMAQVWMWGFSSLEQAIVKQC